LRNLYELKAKDPFHIKPFYGKEDTIIFDPDSSITDYLKEPFLIDMYFEKLNISEPWRDNKESVEMLYKMWKENEKSIAMLFQERKKEISCRYMREYTAIFIEFLFWSNNMRVNKLIDLSKTLMKLEVSPVNCTERLNYILENYNQFQSFIQLQQLFEEAYKSYQLHIALTK
jgi:uncharacterized membrane protein (UPF0127 family)